MNVDLMLRGASGLALLCYFAGILYWGFILMRVRRERSGAVFFWAVVCQMFGLVLMAAMSVVMTQFGYDMMGWGGGGVDWIGMMSSILEGGVLLSSLVGAVALVMLARSGGAR